MIKEQAKIFLADDRGISETSWYRCCSTFNFANYFSEHKTPFAGIEAINDDSLDAGCSIQLEAEKDSYVLLIPVIGAIKYTGPGGQPFLVAAGQAQLLLVKKGDGIAITNPFTEGLINFLHIWISRDDDEMITKPQIVDLNINGYRNSLKELPIRWPGSQQVPFVITVGKFDGRHEARCRVKKSNGLLVFIIEGAFEVQGRLLHARDALGLRNIDEVEMEALSNDAIILAMETPLRKERA